MIPAWFTIFAIILRLTGGATYAVSVVKGRAKPNPITWFFWALTPMIVFAAQLFEGVGWSAAMTFALGLGPLVIFILSLRKNWSRAHFTPATIACAICAAAGVVLWQITNDPLLAIIFSIMADIFGGIPTVIKAYVAPRTEVAMPYFMSMLAMAVTLLALDDWSVAGFLFPMYMLSINTVIFSLIWLRPKLLRHAGRNPAS